MKIGYACVSTGDQNPTPQLAALKRERCKRIFIDKASGVIRTWRA
jgi:DNA invertase Pin-like site-specific DNA recombinase